LHATTFPQIDAVDWQMPRGKHVPAWQTWFDAQLAPQTPQLVSSVWRLTQTPRHKVVSLGQVH
jgi:hypothetical protein